MDFDPFVKPIMAALPKLPDAILSLVFGYLAIWIAMALFSRALKVARVTKGLRDVLISMASVVLWILLISVIAKNLGLGQVAAAITGSLIVLGFAIANGASTMTADILAGLLLAKDQDFKVGYKVKIGDVEGIIDKLDIRKVRITGKNDHRYVISNSQVDKSSWEILSRE